MPDLPFHFLWKITYHILSFVPLTALNEGLVSKNILNYFVQSFRAVNDNQYSILVLQSPADQIPEKTFDASCIFRGGLYYPQWDFVPVIQVIFYRQFVNLPNSTWLNSNTRSQALLNNPAATTDHLDQQRHRGRLSCLT